MKTALSLLLLLSFFSADGYVGGEESGGYYILLLALLLVVAGMGWRLLALRKQRKELEQRLKSLTDIVSAKRPTTTDDTTCIHCSSDQDWKFIATVKKNVEENMDNPGFNVDTLCALHNMSRTSFYNKIKALTDQAPADYVRLIRLNRATQLLEEQRHSITEIAELTGFSDAKYFREVFKKYFKVSPTQYIKKEIWKET